MLGIGIFFGREAGELTHMNRLFVFLGVFFIAATAFSNQGATRIEGTGTGSDVIPCLGDLAVNFSIDYRAVSHDFFDGSEGEHVVQNYRYHGTLETLDSSMSWSGRGGGPIIVNVNGNNDQNVRVYERQEVWFADGDYPDLLWSFSFSGTTNANGGLVSLRRNFGTFHCLPN